MALYEKVIVLDSAVLGGRDRSMAERLLDEIFKLPRRSLLVLECAKTMFMDFSWADEVVVAIVEAAQDSNITERFVVLRTASPSVAERVDVALNRRGLACVHVTGRGDLQILGALSPVLRETFVQALALKQISAQDLPGDLSPSTKSNRLRDLESKGLVYRVGIENVDGGGRRFLYEVVR